MKVEVQKILISVLQNSAPNSVMKFLHLSHVSRIKNDQGFNLFDDDASHMIIIMGKNYL